MEYEETLEKWRALIEPEISAGLTPVSWQQMLSMRPTVFEGKESVVLSRDVTMGARTSRSIWVAAGVLDEVMELIAQVEQSARSQGIKSILFVGRRGWIKALVDYKELAVVGLKEL